jgi:C1A family cysteine protease
MPLPLSPAGRRYGAFRSPVDHRDFGVSSVPKLKSGLLPARDLYLFDWLGPVRDQGSEGSCTAHAGYAMRMLLANQFERNNNRVLFSPAALYYLARKMDGTLPEDAGSTGRTIVRVLNRYGACPESDDPYGPATLNTPPSPEAMLDAKVHRAGAYHRIASVEDMKACIVSGYGAIVGFVVYESFESESVAKSGLMPIPDKRNERLLGGHEVFFWGYDDAKRAFAVQNSWGANWGAGGHFWFPYECFADPDIMMDAWIQHLGPPWGQKTSFWQRLLKEIWRRKQ